MIKHSLSNLFSFIKIFEWYVKLIFTKNLEPINKIHYFLLFSLGFLTENIFTFSLIEGSFFKLEKRILKFSLLSPQFIPLKSLIEKLKV